MQRVFFLVSGLTRTHTHYNMWLEIVDTFYPLVRGIASASDMVPVEWFVPFLFCFTIVGLLSTCVHSTWVAWVIGKAIFRFFVGVARFIGNQTRDHRYDRSMHHD